MARKKNDPATNALGEAALVISQPFTQKVKICCSSAAYLTLALHSKGNLASIFH